MAHIMTTHAAQTAQELAQANAETTRGDATSMLVDSLHDDAVERFAEHAALAAANAINPDAPVETVIALRVIFVTEYTAQALRSALINIGADLLNAAALHREAALDALVSTSQVGPFDATNEAHTTMQAAQEALEAVFTVLRAFGIGDEALAAGKQKLGR